MGRLVINNSMSVNGAFEAPVPEPDGWLVLDADSNQFSLEQFLGAEAMLLGRKTYEGLAAVWPTLADAPAIGSVRGPDEQHAQVRGVPELASAVGVERHAAGGRPGGRV